MATGTKISDYSIITDPDGDDVLLGNQVDGSNQTTGLFQISDILEEYNIPSGTAPSTAVTSKPVGHIAFDSNYLYITTASGSNKRIPLNTWPHSKAYTISNYTGQRTFDASSYTLDDLVQLLCQLIVDLQALKHLE